MMDENAPACEPKVSGYSWYVLGVLFLVYILNFVDRQILSILANEIKRDLGLNDADLGFLYGTAFGVFFAVFGIPLGRLADRWHRVRLITVGLTLWSAMTALSGLARTGGMLATARIGVGIGEASASPSAYSLLSDWFPKRLRATALALYSAGIYVGGGVSLWLGGTILQGWGKAYPHGGPFGLVAWQAAFLAVGIPGLVMALWVATLREPRRGLSEGLAEPAPEPRPLMRFVEELLAIIPPLTIIGAAREGRRALLVNLIGLAVIGLVVAELIHAGESPPQWLAEGVGVYAVFSWAALLKRRDPATFRLVVANPAFIAVVLAYGLNAFVAYGMSFWAAPYAIRELGAAPARAGLILGGFGALGGFIGITMGGIIADRLRRRFAAGRIAVILFGGLAAAVPAAVAFTTHDLTTFFVAIALANLLAPTALGSAAAATQDLVLPHMRGTATAAFLISTTLIGLALGPYLAGRISDATGSLATGMLSLLAAAPLILIACIAAWRLVPEAERTREARAAAAEQGR